MSQSINTLSSDNKAALSELILLIDELVILGKASLNKFPTDSYELLPFVFINYLERYTYALDSVNILLRSYEKNPNVETSIGLIIRTSLLDFMTVSYLRAYYSDISPNDALSQEKFDEVFNSLLVDHINNTFKYLKLAKNVGFINEKERIETLDSLYHTYHFLFNTAITDYDNPSEALISQKYITPKDLFTKLISHPVTKNDAYVYDMYMYYSKYEHFGIVTHFLQRRGVNEDFSSMIESLTFVVKGLGLSMAFLSKNPDVLVSEKVQFKTLLNKFQNIKVSYGN